VVGFRDGNGYPLPAYPPGKYPLDARVWDKKIPMGIQMEKIYTHRVERVWGWDPKTHTLIPRYPSNSLTCGPPKYQRTKINNCLRHAIGLATSLLLDCSSLFSMNILYSWTVIVMLILWLYVRLKYFYIFFEFVNLKCMTICCYLRWYVAIFIYDTVLLYASVVVYENVLLFTSMCCRL
jgi:hypothetical protein